jgi:hypothetical protein
MGHRHNTRQWLGEFEGERKGSAAQPRASETHRTAELVDFKARLGDFILDVGQMVGSWLVAASILLWCWIIVEWLGVGQ